MPDKKRIFRVGVSDDSPFIVHSVQLTLAAEFERYKIISYPARVDALFTKLKSDPPDILITDFNFNLDSNDLNGVRKIEELQKIAPEMNVVVLTFQNTQAILKKIIQIPIAAIISKRDDRKDLVKAFRWMSQNTPGTFYSEHMKVLTADISSVAKSMLLSPSEIEVVRLFAMGYSLMNIAKARKRSVSTVATQKYNAMRKLHLKSNTDLIKYVFAQELI